MKANHFFAVCVLTIASAPSSAEAAQGFNGTFEFSWLAEPANKHREMKLLSNVSFTDAAGKQWNVPKDTTIDGASIPPALWSFAGSPFVGNYRRASVIHDHFCDLKTEVAADVHIMFREAMEIDGVPYLERQSKYLAVSAYSIVTGACGKPENSFEFWLDNGLIDGFVKSDDLVAALETLQENATDAGTIGSRADSIIELAKVENPVTFQALAEFRRTPSTENFDKLEFAVQAEKPDDKEAEALSALVNATVPEGSLAVPE